MTKLKINPDILGLKESATLAINTRVQALRATGRDIVHFGFGQSPFDVPPSVRAALAENAHRKDYLPTPGLPALREAVSTYLQQSLGQRFAKEHVFIGPGSKELIFQVLFVLQGPVLIPAPSWVSYKPQVDIRRGDTHLIPTSRDDNYKMTPAALEEACLARGEMQKILILNNPSNPTGAVYRDAEIEALANVCRQNNVVVISDEIYAQISYGEEPFCGFTRHYPEGTIVTGGLSKAFSAGGYRIGYLALPEAMTELVRPLIAIFSETFSSVSAPVQYAALAAYSGGQEITDYVQRCTRIHQACSEYLYSGLCRLGIQSSRPEGAFYLFIDFFAQSEQLRSLGITADQQLCDYLLDEFGVALLPGADFYFPEQLLGARLATVDYDGPSAYQAALTEPLNYAFVERHCPQLKLGLERLAKFMQTLSL